MRFRLWYGQFCGGRFVDLCQPQYVWQHAAGIGRYCSGGVRGYHGVVSRVGGLGAGNVFKIDYHVAVDTVYAPAMDIGRMAQRHLAGRISMAVSGLQPG